MIPIVVAASAGLASFIGISLLNKKKGANDAAAPTAKTEPAAPPFIPPALPVLPSIDIPTDFGPPTEIFPAKPFPGRPPPITNAERASILAKPPGTLTATDVANLTVDYTPQQNAVLNNMGTPGLFTSNEASPSDRSEAIRQGISVEELLKRSGGPIQLPRAEITTSSPSPAGDLIVRKAPDGAAPQIGGAPKGGIVTVINMNASSEFAEISWSGGWGFPAVKNYPGVRGFVKKKFLVVK